MKTSKPVLVTDIFQEVVSSMAITGLSPKFVFGNGFQINLELKKMQEAVPQVSLFPLVCLYLPFIEDRISLYYANLVVPRITISALTTYSDSPQKRYEDVFKPVLYPTYYEFLLRLSRHPNIVSSETPHTKKDLMSLQPLPSTTNDFVDTIELSNMKLKLSQTKTC